jgi:4-carboxymuconolactone decarboxylase
MAELSFDPKKLDAQGTAIYESLVAKRKSQGAPFDGPYAALMNHPELCEKIEALGYYLKFEGHLPRDIYQFVVLYVAKRTNSTFEWQDHLPHALEAGIPQAVIEQLKKSDEGNADFPEPYQLAAQVLKTTQAYHNIPEDVQKKAIGVYGVKGFLEIIVLSGFYQMFSSINQGLDIQLPQRDNVAGMAGC